MPWTGKSFGKHNKGLGKKASAKAASVANAVLRESGDEGKAIRIANWNAAGRPGRADGGHVDRRGGGRGVVPYQHGGATSEARKGNGAYLVGEAGPEIFVPRHKGAIVPNHEVKRLGEKYARRQGGGPVKPLPIDPRDPSLPKINAFSSPTVPRWQEGNLPPRGKPGDKLPERQMGGPVQPDTPQAGFLPPRKRITGLQRRGIISNKAKERRLSRRPPSNSKGETETTPIDAASR